MVRIRSPRSLARMILMWIEAHCIRNANRSTIRARERSRRLTTRTRTLRRTPAATAWPMACSDCGLTSTGVVSPKIPQSPPRAGFPHSDVGIPISTPFQRRSRQTDTVAPWNTPRRARERTGHTVPSPAAPFLAEPPAGVRHTPPARHAGLSRRPLNSISYPERTRCPARPVRG